MKSIYTYIGSHACLSSRAHGLTITNCLDLQEKKIYCIKISFLHHSTIVFMVSKHKQYMHANRKARAFFSNQMIYIPSMSHLNQIQIPDTKHQCGFVKFALIDHHQLHPADEKGKKKRNTDEC